MPSFSIHLAVAQKYLEKNKNVKNENDFFKGAIAPDFTDDKVKTHFSGHVDKNDLLLCLRNKVLLYDFLKQTKIDNDYNLGIFLHLLTDYLFFNGFFKEEFVSNISYDDFTKRLYNSYDLLDGHMQEKYNLGFEYLTQEMQENILEKRKQTNVNNLKIESIINEEQIDEFINFVSSIDLQDYAKKILLNKKNVMP